MVSINHEVNTPYTDEFDGRQGIAHSYRVGKPLPASLTVRLQRVKVDVEIAILVDAAANRIDGYSLHTQSSLCHDDGICINAFERQHFAAFSEQPGIKLLRAVCGACLPETH